MARVGRMGREYKHGGSMNFTVHIVQVRGKGVQVVTPGSTSEMFWLPRGSPVVWSEAPEPGAKVSATIPKWLAAKHQSLVKLRGQYAIPFHQNQLDPENAKGPIPMANDTPRGALFRVSDEEKKNDRWPDFRGDIVIEGRKWKLAGWTKQDKNGRKYLSLVASPADERAEDRREQRDWQRPADSDIPF